MADKEYLLKWVIDPTKAVAGAQAIERELLSLERVVDRLGPKLKNIAAGASTSMGGASRSARTLETRLNALETQAQGAGTALQGAGAAAGTAGTNFQAAGTRARTSGGHVDRFGTSLAGLTAGMMVVHQVTRALDAMGDAAKRAREHQEQGAETGLDKRHQARELANLMGESEPSDRVMGRIFLLGMKSGLSFQESLAFLEQVEGSIPAGKSLGHVRESDIDALSVEGSRFASRIGLETSTGGDLVGVIPQFVDLTKDANGKTLNQQQAVEKAAGQLGAIAYGLNEGRGKVSRLASAEIASTIPMLAAGRVQDLAEGAAFAGVGSLFAGRESQAGTRFKQLDRLLNKAGSKSGAEFLREAGVDQAQGNFAKLTRLKEFIDREKPADVQKFLVEKGFGNSEEVASAAGYLANYSVLKERIEKARAIANNGKPTIAADAQYMQGLDAQNQRGKAIQEFGEFEQTRKTQPLAAARKAAIGRLQAAGKIDTSSENFKDWALDFISGPTREWAGEQGTHAMQIDAEAFQGLAESAQAAGIDLTRRFPGKVRNVGKSKSARTGLIGPTGQDLAEIMQAITPELQAKGKAVIGDNAAIEAKAAGLGVPAGKKPPAAPGANGQGGMPGPQAKVDASSLDAAADKLSQAAQAMLQASRSGGPGGPGGGGFGLPDISGFGPVRS